jgi:hypothetical protein
MSKPVRFVREAGVGYRRALARYVLAVVSAVDEKGLGLEDDGVARDQRSVLLVHSLEQGAGHGVIGIVRTSRAYQPPVSKKTPLSQPAPRHGSRSRRWLAGARA